MLILDISVHTYIYIIHIHIYTLYYIYWDQEVILLLFNLPLGCMSCPCNLQVSRSILFVSFLTNPYFF
jgi:hypothetical protein